MKKKRPELNPERLFFSWIFMKDPTNRFVKKKNEWERVKKQTKKVTQLMQLVYSSQAAKSYHSNKKIRI